MLHALPHGVIAADANGRLPYLNAAAAELVGCRPADAAGRPARDVQRIVEHEGRRVPTTPRERALGNRPGVILLQTILGDDTVERWAEICLS